MAEIRGSSVSSPTPTPAPSPEDTAAASLEAGAIRPGQQGCELGLRLHCPNGDGGKEM